MHTEREKVSYSISSFDISNGENVSTFYSLAYSLLIDCWCIKGEDLSGMDWLDPDAPLTGFSWKGGSERDTNGILLWERPFIVKDKNGEEVMRWNSSR